jgi:hypothetical protein
MDTHGQPPLFVESFDDAARAVINACGGVKRVATAMWPTKPVTEAVNLLNACLNTERRERLNPNDVMYLLKLGREANCHALAHWLMRESGYADPVPVEPEDERARLQREFVASVQALQSLSAKMDALGMPVTGAGVRRVA